MKRAAVFLVPLAVLVALVGLFAATIQRDSDYIPSALINEPAPATDLPPVTGLGMAGFGRDDITGGVSVVNVFASWCVPCRDEHPLLMRLAGRDDINLYGINQKDAPENARAFLENLGNPYDRIGADRNGRASIEWGVYGVPETFVVNPDGIITYKHTGPLTEKSFETSLLPAIADARGGTAQ